MRQIKRSLGAVATLQSEDRVTKKDAAALVENKPTEEMLVLQLGDKTKSTY